MRLGASGFFKNLGALENDPGEGCTHTLLSRFPRGLKNTENPKICRVQLKKLPPNFPEPQADAEVTQTFIWACC